MGWEDLRVMDKWKLAGFIALTSLVVVILPLTYIILNPPAKARISLSMRQKNRITPTLMKKLVTQTNEQEAAVIGSISGFEFFGDARDNTRVTGSNEIVLPVNQLGWVGIQINFADPVSLRDNKLVLQAKGKVGDEVLKVGVTDIHRWTTHKVEMVSVNLGKDWKEIVLDKDILKDGVDGNAIVFVKLTSEPPAGQETEIYLKDIVLASQKQQ